jgi:hypothetical protein
MCAGSDFICGSGPLADDRLTRESMSIEEATVSNMWEIAAIVEVLERKRKLGHTNE